VDPAVARFVDRALQHGSEALGYAVVLDVAPPEGSRPDVVARWNRVHQLGVEHSLHATVRARAGLYVVTLQIASRDGSGPRRGEISAGQRELEPDVARWVETTLPRPGTAHPAPVPAATSPAATAPNPRATAAPTAAPAPATPPSASVDGSRDEPDFRLSLRDELVLGLGEDPFVGVLVGAGLDYRLDDPLWLGLRFVYANLPGRHERAQSSLWYLQLEHLTELNTRIAVPLRAGLGYLAGNGSVLRLSSGIAIDVGRGVGLTLDLLAPTFWVTPDRTLFSMSLGLDASLSF
jgi:hypothetical protein